MKGGTIALARTPVQLRRARAERGLRHRRGGRGRRSSAPPACWARRTRRTAHASSPRGSCGASRGPSSAAAGASSRRPRRHRGGAAPGGDRPRRRHARARSCAPPRRWSAQLAPRSVVPVYSLIVATRPLPAEFWDAAGLAGGQTFTDHRHLIVYGQRTADDRLVFGGRGAPYHWRSRIAPAFDRDERVFGGLRAAARDLFPALRPSRFHATRGAARWASRATGTRASATPTGSPGRAATWATAWAPRTSPGARSPRSCSAATTPSPGCPGWGTGRGAGSPSRCAGCSSTRACG